jgi:hypothetical protein
MSFLTDSQQEVNLILAYGEPARIRHYDIIVNGSGYDDDKKFVASGSDIWCSGLKQGLSSKYGSDDAQFIQQGILLQHDSRLYLPGTVDTSGLIKIGLGSPIQQEFSVLNEGTDVGVHIAGDAAYRKLYIRFLKNGSLDGE